MQFLSQNDGPARLVLWVSNTQAATSNGAEHCLGQWLRATYGGGYVGLGLALGQGSYAAENPAGQWVATPLETPPPGSYEAWLRTGLPAFFLSLHKLELTEANAWLFQQQLLRDAGSRQTRHQFGLHDLRGAFDGLVFLRDSTPAHFLP
ncbi:erythromycin esterase family protein [Hymenobacter sp. BRD128]|uniref:erythromycin esterase family protein n=1 Tax=Hymenobacter sp. BRD128 TaxID=2675878 RepID=UPI001563597C|nr:erythromycin esterase family protein [Hymenobacter sp. BRD128]